mgnify:FL=1|jgi:hypothetical protein
MNERIRKIAKDAGFDWHKYWEGDNNRLAKFAELIVKECAETVEGSAYIEPTLELIADDIREHFGVTG